MSKASQRKSAAFDLGYQDVKKGILSRYSSHPFLKEYKRGRLIAVMDLKNNARIARGEPNPPHDGWGPEPT